MTARQSVAAATGFAPTLSVPAGAHPPTAGGTAAVRTALATVCISGTLEDKLDAAARAGFDGVEIFEPDLVGSPWSPARIGQECADRDLRIEIFQPFRDLDSVDEERFAANLRRAERKFDLMQALGTDLVLVCSSVSDDAVDDADRLAAQLHALAGRAAERGLRIAYEALAWGRTVSTWERSWEVVRRAGHPALGLCLDSFHILARGGDPAGIAAIPGEKLFFLQLADAPNLDMDVLQWSRHHRLFPGQGAFDLPAFLSPVLSAGYTGPLSLEVFNDVFRQSDPRRAAVDARRSLVALQEATLAQLPPGPARERLSVSVPPPQAALDGYAFTELAVDDGEAGEVAATLAALGFAHVARHRSKPVQLWRQGGATVLLNAAPFGGGTPSSSPARGVAAVVALGVSTADPAAAALRAQAMFAPVLPRDRGVGEADLAAVAAPDGTEVFLCGTTGGDRWLDDFVPTGDRAPEHPGITHVDHVELTQPYDFFDEAALFYRSLLGLRTQHSSEIAAPYGLVRTRAVADPGRTVRLCLSGSVLRRGGWGPALPDPQHVAFGAPDVLAVARRARAAGAPVLDLPVNYYDDLDARFALPAELLEQIRELGVMYDRDATGEFLHFHTAVLGGRMFLEVAQRIGDYAGYGEAGDPVRMAAHRRMRGIRAHGSAGAG